MKAGEIAVALLVPVVTALLGAFGIVLRDLYERRSERGQYTRAYDDAARKVAFATEWWKAQRELGMGPDEMQSARETAQSWLGEATALIDRSVKPSRRPEDRYSLMRRVLLAYQFKSMSARVLRIVYYFMLFLMVYNLAIDVSMSTLDGFTGEYWSVTLMGLLLLGLPALGARAWAVSIEQHAARRPTRVPAPMPSVANHQVSAAQRFSAGPSPTPGTGWAPRA
ncbi:hypothetical protein [Nocardia sp. NPDC051463]|uniref:hypothetical protein n=1 Tax=Nocardia sp. NPDC051463 TaxID=3154845 RepID=UPI003428A7E1